MRILKIYISQGNIATRLRCGGFFNDRFIANDLESVMADDFLNRWTFGEDMNESMCVSFFWLTMY